jgi:glycosyltransferase involved in cell wall biosynthesis
VSLPRVAALVPAYEAASTVGDVVGGTRAIVPDVVVVDDGSTDATGDVARAAGAVVLRQAPNAGKGAALVRGFRHLHAAGFTHAVTLDADGQHYPGEIPVLLRVLADAPDALVVGVRQKEGQEISPIARFGNWFADAVMPWIVGQALPDTQSGFRVYPLAATLGLETVGTRYDFETEVLFRAARQGVPIVGVPVRVYYPPIAERVSHFDPWWDTARIVCTVLRVLASPFWTPGGRVG